MALSIGEACVNCWACVDLCPVDAIHLGVEHFVIDPQQCSQCEGYFAEPQCASICPVEEAVIDPKGNPVNPKGSLSGIAQARLDAVKREIQAR